MGKVNLTSEKLQEILARNKASRAGEERAARALLNEDESGILEIADYVSKVIRVLRKIPTYQALPSGNYRESSRWKMYSRLYCFCKEWDINPKFWIDAMTDFMLNVVSAANDDIFISEITSVREGTMEIFDQYCAENYYSMLTRGAAYEVALRPTPEQIEWNKICELSVNLMSGRISDGEILKIWEPKLLKWNESVRDYLYGRKNPVLEKHGADWAKFLYYKTHTSELYLMLIPFVPCGRIFANPRDKDIILRLSRYYYTRPDLCEKLYEIWRGHEYEFHIPGGLLGCLKESEKIVNKFGRRGIDMNTVYEMPSVPYDDAELKGASES